MCGTCIAVLAGYCAPKCKAIESRVISSTEMQIQDLHSKYLITLLMSDDCRRMRWSTDVDNCICRSFHPGLKDCEIVKRLKVKDLPIRPNLIGILLRASLGVLVVSTSSLWWRKMVCLGKSSISSCIAYAPSSLLLAEWKVSLQDYRRKHREKPVTCLYSWICVL